MKNLRIIFMGTPEFAVPSLEILLQNQYNIVAVMTAPDKPAGRGKKLRQSAIKECALKHNIPILQPTNLKSPEFLEELRSYQANLQVVVAFRMLPELVWGMPQIGTFNLHASFLPDYRGAAPINWAIMNGEKETGITTFFLQHQIDTGEIILQKKEPITHEDTVGTLYERLRQKGAKLVLETCQIIESENYQTFPQQVTPENLAKKAPKIFRETCEINFDQPAEKVRDFIRGLSPYPVAWTTLQDKICKIYAVKATQQPSDKQAGSWETDNKTFLRFYTSDGFVEIETLQWQGRKRLSIQDFLRGAKLNPNS